MQIIRMRGFVFSMLAGSAIAVMGMTPETAAARESEQAESGSCPCKSQRRIIRPLIESTPIRKKDKERVRRILM